MIVLLPVSRSLPPSYPGWLPTAQYARLGQALVPGAEQLRRMERRLGGAGPARRRLEGLYRAARDPGARLGAADLAAALEAPPEGGEDAAVTAARAAARALLDEAGRGEARWPR